MTVQIIIDPRAQQQAESLPDAVQAAVTKRVALLQGYPNVPGVKALKGSLKGLLRLRAGDYRIVFRVEKGIVRIVAIDDRKDVYDRDAEMRMTQNVRDVVTKVRTSTNRPVEAIGFLRRSLGAKLRKMRLDAGLTQAALAKKVRRAASTIGLAEQGRISVSPAYVESVIRVCHQIGAKGS